MADQVTRNRSNNTAQKAIIGAGLAAAAGTAAFLLARRTGSAGAPEEGLSESPRYTWRRSSGRYEEGMVGRTVSINKPKEDIYRAWRDFTGFSRFMENVERVEDVGDGRSKWTIKAPLGTSVELVTRITEDRPGEAIGWKSEPESQISTEGHVEFFELTPGRGTTVRLTMKYDPPAGLPGRALAKILQREPNVQARRDLRRFKMLLETGEIATNAGPSARKSETPTQPKI